MVAIAERSMTAGTFRRLEVVTQMQIETIGSSHAIRLETLGISYVLTSPLPLPILNENTT